MKEELSYVGQLADVRYWSAARSLPMQLRRSLRLNPQSPLTRARLRVSGIRRSLHSCDARAAAELPRAVAFRHGGSRGVMVDVTTSVEQPHRNARAHNLIATRTGFGFSRDKDLRRTTAVA
jgi:hypothetical protein